MILCAVGLLAARESHSQGTTTCVSSLGQPAAGSESVGSDSWVATLFGTGNNSGGYALNSVQLAMTPALGAPGGFTAMLYSVSASGAILPLNSLGALNGPGDPEGGGVYTYTASGLMLSPSTDYFIVLMADTPISSGAYAISLVTFPPNLIGGWAASGFVGISSDDGSSWNFTPGYVQSAFTASAVPEPSVVWLFGLSGLFFFGRYWQMNKTPRIRLNPS
jgi:hypothetical protein